MSYDYLDRLANASIGNINYVYSYNAIGNILKIVRDNNNTTKFVYYGNPIHAPDKIETNTDNVGVDVHKEANLYSDNKNRSIQFYLVNEKNSTINNANWSVKFSNSIINSTIAFNITPNESILVIAAHNYSNAGNYSINVTGRADNTSTDYENVTLRFGVYVSSLAVNSMNTNKVTFELALKNDMNVTAACLSWVCSTGNQSSGTCPITLSANQERLENFSYVYSSPGNKVVTCNVTSNDGKHGKSIEFELKGIRIEDYNSTVLAENQRMVNFTIKNYWKSAAVTWYITSDGQTFTNTTSNISTNETASVSQTINYTADGSKNISINITSDSLVDKLNESFILKALRIENYDNINLTSTKRLLEFNVKNNWYLNQSVKWNITDPNITSNLTANLTAGESIIILIENNYTSPGTKKPKITAYNNSFIASFIDWFIV